MRTIPRRRRPRLPESSHGTRTAGRRTAEAPEIAGEHSSRSLRAAIDWSVRLLSPELQQFFGPLCVFRGWTLEAAAAVCEESSASEQLEKLQKHSLIAVEDRGGEMRYRLLDTLRDYAREPLTPEGLAAAAQ